MTEIFLSYKREDRDCAKRVAEVLTMRGYNVWWDTSLVAGDAFGDKINAQLDQAKLVLTLWSQGALSSPWVKAESQRAWEQRKYLGILMESYQRHLTLTDMSPLSHSVILEDAV